MKLFFSRPRIEDLDKYLANREYDKALAAVADELKRNPQQFNVLMRKAEILGTAGDPAKAIKVYLELAEQYSGQGYHAKAIALYKQVLRLNPNLPDVHKQLASLIEQDRETEPMLEERVGLSNEDFEAESREPDRLQQAKELTASALFSSFTQEALEQVLSSTSLRIYNEGDIIVTEGEQGSSLFLIVSGSVKVFTLGQRGEHVPLAELCAGDFFGEVSLLTGKPRTATITAKERVMAIEISKSDVDRIAQEHPEVRNTMENFYNRRAHETVEAVIRRMRGGS